MNPLVELNLALILFLPWFLILGALYWIYPRAPRHTARTLFDITALALSIVAFLYSIHWAQDNASVGRGKIWPQVLAASLGYGVWLSVMTAAFFIRRRWLRRRTSS